MGTWAPLASPQRGEVATPAWAWPEGMVGSSARGSGACGEGTYPSWVQQAPGGFGPPTQPGRFSPDGYWWYDGAEWRPAISPDRLWRWNGQAWVPSQMVRPPSSGGGAGLAVGITVGLFLLVLLVTGLFVVVILYTMGNQIANVFSNVTAALTGP
jgi:hypothetical protein